MHGEVTNDGQARSSTASPASSRKRRSEANVDPPPGKRIKVGNEGQQEEGLLARTLQDLAASSAHTVDAMKEIVRLQHMSVLHQAIQAKASLWILEALKKDEKKRTSKRYKWQARCSERKWPGEQVTQKRPGWRDRCSEVHLK
jgi:hypothetical protein